MLFRPEVPIALVDKKWYSKHGDGSTYADRLRAFRETLPNAQEFVVHLPEAKFVPIRHLIVQAMLELQENANVYAGIEGESLAQTGRLTASNLRKSADGSVFAHTLDHLSTLEGLSKPMPDLDRDPFILFHLARTEQPVILRYDTAKLQPNGDDSTHWRPIEGETAASAVDGVFYLQPGER